MWILPRQLHTSAFVPDTEALISDSNEQSRLCAQSLLARSKPSPARTWSQRWKRDSWTRHLSGRILKPSHGPSFVTAWTSSQVAIHASRFQQPASGSAPKTQDTSGRLSQPELLSCDQVSVSLKTSKDISRWGCPTSSKTWQDWVTQQRGAYSARVKSARRISASGSLSWPSVVASEVRQGFQDRSRGKKGSQESLTTAVIKQWPSASSRDWKGAPRSRMTADGYNARLDEAVVLYGQAAPASSSSLGSRQGLWLTPRANEPDSDPNFAARNADRGAHCHGTLSSQAKREQWATPAAFDWNTAESQAAWQKRANEQKAKGVNLHLPLKSQAVHEAEKSWATPQAKDHKSGHRDASIVQYKQLNVEVEAKATGKLNPRWVETLMGLPIGWTMPSCIRPVTIAPTNSDCSEMALCPPAQSERSEFLLAS